MMDGIYLLLGTNLGNKLSHLMSAIRFLKENHIKIIKFSSIYETEAWGYQQQPSFYNQTVQVSTQLSPEELLVKIKEIEKKIGRTKNEKWKERIIDIDILYYDSEIIQTPDLQIPHPEIPNRKFTLLPISEIAPAFVHPISKKDQVQLLTECRDSLEVIKLINQHDLPTDDL